MSDEAKKVDGKLRTDEIADRLKEASPGKWKVGGDGCSRHKVTRGDLDVCTCWAGESDAEFIANAPADIEWLLRRIEDLEEEIQEMYEAQEEIDGP